MVIGIKKTNYGIIKKISKLGIITRNAWGAFSINSHINQHTHQPKIMYSTVTKAQKAADKMSQKNNTHFSYYKCLFCDGYHIGKNRENKTDYDKK